MKVVIAISLFFFMSELAFSQTPTPKKDSHEAPFILGVVDQIQSRQLGETRILNIYLPEGYKKSDTLHYPVVYLLDGSANEDFIHITGLYQFNSFSWVNRVPESIIVGIANIDRRRDFTFPTMIKEDQEKYPTTGHSDKFMAFIEKELQPYIEANYKTNTSKTLIGESLGGLLATEILLKKPTLFNKYIIVSPSIWWNNGSILNEDSQVLKESFSQQTQVYIGVGKEGLTSTKIPRVMEVDANLLAEKIKNSKSKSVKVYFDYLPDENHATIMHQAVYNALKMLIN
jgi:uncharacterized protein